MFGIYFSYIRYNLGIVIYCWFDYNIINYLFILNKNKLKLYKILLFILSCIMGRIRQLNCIRDEGVGQDYGEII